MERQNKIYFAIIYENKNMLNVPCAYGYFFFKNFHILENKIFQSCHDVYSIWFQNLSCFQDFVDFVYKK